MEGEGVEAGADVEEGGADGVGVAVEGGTAGSGVVEAGTAKGLNGVGVAVEGGTAGSGVIEAGTTVEEPEGGADGVGVTVGGGTAGSGEVEVSGRDAAVCLPILKRGVGLIIFVVALVEKEKGLSI